MTTETNRLDPAVLRAIAPELAAKIEAQDDEIAELRDELHTLSLTFRRHQSKALLRDAESAQDATDDRG